MVMIVDGHMHVGEFRVFDVAEPYPDACQESPGMPTHSKAREAVGHVGPARATHGSDSPFHHPSVVLAKVRVSGLSTDLTDRVLGENGLRLFLAERTPEAVA